VKKNWDSLSLFPVFAVATKSSREYFEFSKIIFRFKKNKSHLNPFLQNEFLSELHSTSISNIKYEANK